MKRSPTFLPCVALCALLSLPANAGPWVYCVAGAGILGRPDAQVACVPPKAPDDALRAVQGGDQ